MPQLRHCKHVFESIHGILGTVFLTLLENILLSLQKLSVVKAILNTKNIYENDVFPAQVIVRGFSRPLTVSYAEPIDAVPGDLRQAQIRIATKRNLNRFLPPQNCITAHCNGW